MANQVQPEGLARGLSAQQTKEVLRVTEGLAVDCVQEIAPAQSRPEGG